MTRPLLSLANIEKRFGELRAVNGVTLDIHENEFFALLGASGSGKTTLLRMLAGFEIPSSGSILLDGRDISQVPPNHRPVNLMFQSYALFPHMSVAQNIAYGLEMERLPRSEINQRVDEMLSTIQLAHLAERKPHQLSGGQQQRVALGRALVKRPRLLLLDEPLGALDKKLRGEMQLELKHIQNTFGITFIVVTHDQEEALVMADRIAILKDGALLQCGSPRDIYEYPIDRFAADFIGIMNFLPSRVDAGALSAADGSRISALLPGDLKSGDNVLAAVRPERLRLGAADAENCLSGQIRAMAYHGLDLHLHLDTPLSSQPLMVRLTADAAEGHPFAVGEKVTVGWSAHDTRVFTV
ncbi:ABC transporter ATP-binding protein [Halomonas salipaludis]|uniref:Spermidine/putrescine import ATP-binding protein PotA n=1 Tax=Halomonas salipaludis TaxID=2032625 RepID=A0A2A2F1K5_9GAMM|nr:ABC transporter ATP-binding protein [Halomonas salipaludis]PAU78818.1 spermidine/putrescine ABC transporter ATP-binding protein [Halomonas salipaludis]